MKPNELNEATITRKARGPRIENMAVRISDIELHDDQPSYFVGNRVDNNEPVRVRLMTVAEAVEANLRKDAKEGDRDRLQNYFHEKFVSGSFVRPNPSKFADPDAKEHVQPGGVVLFDRAIKNDDGTYRAQWATTIAPTPKENVMHAVVHLDAREENPSQKQKAMVKATVLSPEKAVELAGPDRVNMLHALMTNEDTQGNPRNAAPAIRLTLSDGSLQHVNIPSMSKVVERQDFNTGEIKKHRIPLPPEEAIKAILEDPAMSKTRNSRLAKAVLSGITGQEANWGQIDDKQRATLERLAKSIAENKTPVTGIPGQVVFAGNQTAVKMLKESARPTTPMGKLLNSTREKEVPYGEDTLTVKEATYCEVVLSLMRHKDNNSPFLRNIAFASPFPQFQTLNEIKLGHPEPVAEAKQELDEQPLDMGLDDQDIDNALDAAVDLDDDGPGF